MPIGQLVPTTELDAINDMLAINGSAPVTDLEEPLAADVEMALNLIRRVMRDVQAHGWHFNTDREVTLEREIEDEGDPVEPWPIPVPEDALRVKKSNIPAQRNLDIAHRGQTLWNRRTNTNLFHEDVVCDVVRALAFEDMPETARSYVVIAAGRKFQEQTIGSAEISGFTEDDQRLAYEELRDAEGLLESTDFIDNFIDQRGVWEVIERVSREVQARGWKFNTRINVGIEPVLSGEMGDDNLYVFLTEDVLVAKKANTSQMANFDLAQHGRQMFDVRNDTTIFNPADLPNGKVYLDLTMYMEFDNLPPTAQEYIRIKAGRQLQAQRNGTQPEAVGYTPQDEERALKTLRKAEGMAEDYNLLRNETTARGILDRTQIYGRGPMRRWGN